jgi:hypothetical protein
MASTPIAKLMERLEQLEHALAQTRADVTRAEERAARAEAHAEKLESATGNLAAAVVSPKQISRRALLTKAAAVGAAGLGGAIILAKPKDVHAAFTWNGGSANAADLPTTVTSIAGFPSGYVLRIDANQAANPNTNIDGLQAVGSNTYSGIAAFGGNKGGAAYYGVGGPATGTGTSGRGLLAYAGSTAAGQNAGRSIEAYQQNQQNAVYTWNGVMGAAGSAGHNAFSNGLWSWGADRGWGLWGDGGGGNGASPTVGGGIGVYGNSGPGPDTFGVVGYGDLYGYNPAQPAHGTAGFGNALGVGGWFSGGRAALALGVSGSAGPPTAGIHWLGDIYLDNAGVIWVCVTTGTPGTFVPLQPGGNNQGLYTAVSTQQFLLTNSDGASWVDMDATNLKLTITPKFNCLAVLRASADLWTASAGFNQDIGIAVAGGAFPTAAGQPEGWKESGGFAGTFSPNAAAVETIVPLAVGVAYTVTLVWKANKNGTSTIAAGAGPINGKFSPTRLTAQLVPTKAGGLTPTTPAKYEIPAAARPPAQQRPGTIPPVNRT